MKHTTALAKLPIPTGNPWLSSPDDPATIPVPLPVIIVSVEGPYTEQDRKLWTFLLHAVWDDLGEKVIHEIRGVSSRRAESRAQVFSFLYS